MQALFDGLKKECGSFLFYFCPNKDTVWSHVEKMKFGQALNTLLTAIRQLTELEMKGHPEMSPEFLTKYQDILLGMSVTFDTAVKEADRKVKNLKSSVKK